MSDTKDKKSGKLVSITLILFGLLLIGFGGSKYLLADDIDNDDTFKPTVELIEKLQSYFFADGVFADEELSIIATLYHNKSINKFEYSDLNDSQKYFMIFSQYLNVTSEFCDELKDELCDSTIGMRAINISDYEKTYKEIFDQEAKVIESLTCPWTYISTGESTIYRLSSCNDECIECNLRPTVEKYEYKDKTIYLYLKAKINDEEIKTKNTFKMKDDNTFYWFMTERVK